MLLSPDAAPILPPRALIGMVHVFALPGTPKASMPVGELARRAAEEARVLAEAGFDGLIVENMHDVPYVKPPHGPEVTAAMTRIALAVREAAPKLALGVQVLSFGHHEALAVAQAADARFIRVENFTFSHVADEGILPDAAAGALLRHRRHIGAEGVRVFCDIKKKHAAHAITADVPVADMAHSAEMFGADGVIVSGAFTGRPTSVEDVGAAKDGTTLPVWVGSGVTPDQVGPLLARADALIVGTWIKQGGVWHNPVDPQRCRRLVAARG